MGLSRITVASMVALGMLAPVASPVLAKGVIKADKKVYDAGTVFEGEKESVKHTFKLKNTGDEVLKITKVRPG
jgi:hypothetical protein